MHVMVTSTALSAEDKIRRLLSAFLSGRNERTMRAYGADLDDFRKFLGAEDIDGAAWMLLSSLPGDANAMVLAYRTRLVERELAPSTVNRRLASLRSLTRLGRSLGIITWTVEIGSLKTMPYRDVRGPGVYSVRRMLEGTQARGDRKGKRDVALLRLLYDLGLRRGEAASLDVADVDLQNATLKVMGKGRTEKEVLTLPRPTRDALSGWLEERGTDPGPLFLGIDKGGRLKGRLSGSGIYRVVKRAGLRRKLRPTRKRPDVRNRGAPRLRSNSPPLADTIREAMSSIANGCCP